MVQVTSVIIIVSSDFLTFRLSERIAGMPNIAVSYVDLADIVSKGNRFIEASSFFIVITLPLYQDLFSLNICLFDNPIHPLEPFQHLHFH